MGCELPGVTLWAYPAPCALCPPLPSPHLAGPSHLYPPLVVGPPARAALR